MKFLIFFILFLIRIIFQKNFILQKKQFNGIQYNTSNNPTLLNNNIILNGLFIFLLYPIVVFIILSIPSIGLAFILRDLTINFCILKIQNVKFFGIHNWFVYYSLSILICLIIFLDCIYFLYLKKKIKTTFGLNKIDLSFKQSHLTFFYLTILFLFFLISNNFIAFNSEQIYFNNFWSFKTNSIKFIDIKNVKKNYFYNDNNAADEDNYYYDLIKFDNSTISLKFYVANDLIDKKNLNDLISTWKNKQ